MTSIRTGRKGHVNIEYLFVVMLLSVIAYVLATGLRWARIHGEAPLAAISWGAGSVTLFFLTLIIFGCAYALLTSWPHLRSDFYDSLHAFLASSIVIAWFVLVLSEIVYAVIQFFATVHA